MFASVWSTGTPLAASFDGKLMMIVSGCSASAAVMLCAGSASFPDGWAANVAALDQPRAMADAVRAALVDRLVHRVRTERLAGVRGAVDVVVDDELECVLVDQIGRASWRG